MGRLHNGEWQSRRRGVSFAARRLAPLSAIRSLRPMSGLLQLDQDEIGIMHLVDNGERVRQLRALGSAIQALLPALSGVETLRGSMPAYESCLAETKRLLDHCFTQDDLSALSRAVPRLFWLHKEWTPQLVQRADGSFAEPTWFDAADRLHQAVQDAAEALRIIGRY